MSGRPPIKLKLGPRPIKLETPDATTSSVPKFKLTNKAAKPEQTEHPNGTHTPKIKFKIGSRKDTKKPADSAPKATKPRKNATATTKANATTIKTTTPKSKKRTKAQFDEDGVPGNTSRPAIKRIKLINKHKGFMPHIRIKAKGRPPERPLGSGYDSEASDREIDPAIEEEFILRMLPGDDCDYVRKAIEEKRIGISHNKGGADVKFTFYTKNGTRASICVRGNYYAATMVDLPCIIEGMKSWDKKGWWKTADICQMLLVFAKCANEEECKTVPIPADIEFMHGQWPHGLAPPLHNVRKRRFRKRVSNRTIEAVEEEVERLLMEDSKKGVLSTRYELVDLDRVAREASGVRSGSGSDGGGFDMLGNVGMEGYDSEEDAEGETDEFYEGDGQESGVNSVAGLGLDQEVIESDGEADLEAELHAAMMADEPTPTEVNAEHQSESESESEGESQKQKQNQNQNLNLDQKESENEKDNQIQVQTQSEIKHEHEHEHEHDDAGTFHPGFLVHAQHILAPSVPTTPASSVSEMEDQISGSVLPSEAVSEVSESESEEDEEEEESSPSDSEVDEETRERQQMLSRQHEEIEDLRRAIRSQEQALEKLSNPLLRQKVQKQIASLKADLRVKMGIAGMEEEEGDVEQTTATA